MGITFTNNWKNIADKLRSTLRTEFKGSLPVYINDENQSAGGQHMRLELAGTSLTEKLLDCELREYSVNMFYVFESPNVKKNSLDHILRYTSRIEQLMQNNISLTLTDSTAAVNCRIESTELEQGEDNTYLVSFEWKCQHLSGLSEVVATTPALLNNFSLNFDGTDDYVDVSGILSELTTHSQGSISAWVKLAASGGGNQKILAASDTATTNNAITFDIHTDKVRIWRNSGGVSDNLLANTTLSSGAWHHVVLTSDGSDWRLYLNGSLDVTAGGSGTWFNGSFNGLNNCLIGALVRTGSPEYVFNGNIDEVAIWDKALSATEITAIYNSKTSSSATLDLGYDTPDYTSSSNLVAYWRMGDGKFDSYNIIASQKSPSLGSQLMSNGDAEGASPSPPTFTDGDGTAIAAGSTSGSTDGGYQTNWERDITNTISGRVNIWKVIKDGSDAKMFPRWFINADGNNTGKAFYCRVDVYLPSAQSVTNATLRASYSGAGGTNFLNAETGAVSTTTTQDSWVTLTGYFAITSTSSTSWFIDLGITAADEKYAYLDNFSVKQVDSDIGVMTNMASADIEEDTP